MEKERSSWPQLKFFQNSSVMSLTTGLMHCSSCRRPNLRGLVATYIKHQDGSRAYVVTFRVWATCRSGLQIFDNLLPSEALDQVSSLG